MLDKIKYWLSHLNAKFYLAFFLFTWLVAWGLNAVKGANFDLDKLTDLYKWLILHYGVDSTLNTEIPALQQIKKTEVPNGHSDSE